MFQAVRAAALAAIQTQDALLEAWRKFDEDPSQGPLTSADRELLQQLVFRKIYPLPAFRALARADVDAALTALLDRYLGQHVDPDRGFDGFLFDMDSMLADLVEFQGESALRKLLKHPRFNAKILSDPRFVEAASNALRHEPEAFPKWLKWSPPDAGAAC